MATDITDRREELLQRLAVQAETLATSDGWRDWLRFASRFRSYSLGNQLLIAAQCPGATWVAGYRTWQQLGRQVRHGEHGIAILAPLVHRRPKDDEPADATAGDEPLVMRKPLVGFRVVFVFDVDQTDGKPLPTRELPAVRAPHPSLREYLAASATIGGLTVRTVPHTDTGARGWYEPKTKVVTLVGSYPIDSQIRTLLHELAHACDPAVESPNMVRAERELVAESAAYLVGTELGIDMHDASTEYVTSWGADRDVLTRLAKEVLDVANALEHLVIPPATPAA